MGRGPALSLPINGHSGAEFRSYPRANPIFSLRAGHVLVSLTLPDRLLPDHVAFARALADQAAAYATEVERIYRNGNTDRRTR